MPKFRLRQVLSHGLCDVVSVGNAAAVFDNAPVVKMNLLNNLDHGGGGGAGSAAVLSVSASPVAALVATASRDGTIRLFSLATCRFVGKLEGHTGCVRSVAFSPTNKRLLMSCGEDATARFWNVQTRCELVEDEGGSAGSDVFNATLTTGHTNFVTTCAFTPDGTICASGGHDDKIILYKAPVEITPASNPTFGGAVEQPDSPADATAAGAAARSVAAAAAAAGQQDDATTTFIGNDSFDANAPQSPMTPNQANVKKFSAPLKIAVISEAHGLHVTALRFTADFLVSSGGKGTIKFWDFRGRKHPVLHGECQTADNAANAANAIAFSADNKILAVASSDKLVHFYDATSRTEMTTNLLGHAAAVTAISFSPDSMLAVSGDEEGNVKLWQTATGKLVTTLKSLASSTDGSPQNHSGAITGFSFVDNRAVFSSSVDGTCRLWLISRGHIRGKGHVFRMPAAISEIAVVPSDGKPMLRLTDVTGGSESSDISSFLLWQEDSSAKTCAIEGCETPGKEFGTFHRRHHCRLCFQVACAGCVRKLPDAISGGSAVKCCKNCLNLHATVSARIETGGSAESTAAYSPEGQPQRSASPTGGMLDDTAIEALNFDSSIVLAAKKKQEDDDDNADVAASDDGDDEAGNPKNNNSGNKVDDDEPLSATLASMVDNKRADDSSVTLNMSTNAVRQSAAAKDNDVAKQEQERNRKQLQEAMFGGKRLDIGASEEKGRAAAVEEEAAAASAMRKEEDEAKLKALKKLAARAEADKKNKNKELQQSDKAEDREPTAQAAVPAAADKSREPAAADEEDDEVPTLIPAHDPAPKAKESCCC